MKLGKALIKRGCIWRLGEQRGARETLRRGAGHRGWSEMAEREHEGGASQVLADGRKAAGMRSSQH